jgi:hypothetical protein
VVVTVRALRKDMALATIDDGLYEPIPLTSEPTFARSGMSRSGLGHPMRFFVAQGCD